jgi:hypothetical protein
VSRSEGRGGQNPAHVAQSVERVLGKDEVTSSILVVGSIGCEKLLEEIWKQNEIIFIGNK